MSEIAVREATPGDWPAVVALLRLALGKDDDPRYDAFLRWKHHENPLGPSYGWVAESASGELAGVRLFLRWRFLVDGDEVDAVRAVDTATHPSFRGKGVFRTLTLAAVDELTAAGVGFVFNTPNDQSRPGYLKMGWRPLGRPLLALRPATATRVVAMARSRRPAALYSEPDGSAVSDWAALGAELAARSRPLPGQVATAYTPELARWRFGFEHLHYRVDAGDAGRVVYRVRRRGDAREATVVAATTAVTGAAVRRLLRASGADWAVWCPAPGDRPGLALRTRRLAPLVVVRPMAVDPEPPVESWRFTAGDLELF